MRHGAENTPEGRSLRLLREWLSPAQRAQFAEKSYFEVVGGGERKALQDPCRDGDERVRDR
jgi:hypothetical protein